MWKRIAADEVKGHTDKLGLCSEVTFKRLSGVISF